MSATLEAPALPMPGILVAIYLAPLPVAGIIGLLLRKLRRAGQPDQPGEIVTAAGAALAAGHAAAQLALDHPPLWLPYAFLTPWMLSCYGYAFYRLRSTLHRRAAPYDHAPK